MRMFSCRWMQISYKLWMLQVFWNCWWQQKQRPLYQCALVSLNFNSWFVNPSIVIQCFSRPFLRNLLQFIIPFFFIFLSWPKFALAFQWWFLLGNHIHQANPHVHQQHVVLTTVVKTACCWWTCGFALACWVIFLGGGGGACNDGEEHSRFAQKLFAPHQMSRRMLQRKVLKRKMETRALTV